MGPRGQLLCTQAGGAPAYTQTVIGKGKETLVMTHNLEIGWLGLGGCGKGAEVPRSGRLGGRVKECPIPHGTLWGLGDICMG